MKNLNSIRFEVVIAVTATALVGVGISARAQVSQISAAPNPCSSGEIAVWTPASSPGYVCISLTQYNASAPGTWNVACPNGGAYNASIGVWECNGGPSPVISQQYVSCLQVFGPAGLCDPSGFGPTLLSNFLPEMWRPCSSLLSCSMKTPLSQRASPSPHE